MNKTEVWVPVQYFSNYAKLPGHTPPSEPKATPQPSSPEHISKHSGLSPLFYLTSGLFLLLTLRTRNLRSPTLTGFQTHYMAAGSSNGLHPRSVMLSYKLEWRTAPLPTCVSTGHIISPSVKVAPLLITKVWLDSIKFCLMLQHSGWKQSMACNLTSQGYVSVQDKSKNTKLHNFHRSRGNFPFHTWKCSSNGVSKLFSFTIQ